MKFIELPYDRPIIEVVSQDIQQAIEVFKNAQTTAQAIAAMEKVAELRTGFETASTLVSIRHSINTNDPFYEEEKQYFNQVSPEYSAVINEYYQAVHVSPFKQELEKEFGAHFFNLVAVTVETFTPDMIELMQRENELVSKYNKLIANAKIDVQGKTLNMSQLAPYTSGKDRSLRKEASEGLYTWLEKEQQLLDETFDELVKVRHAQAKMLGLENYIELGYKKLSRTDYGAKEVAEYRKAIKEYIVPVIAQLKKRQAARIGIDQMKYYDNGFQFNTGNATPKGDPEFILNGGRQMYKELSPETHEFFQFMEENGLMDLVAGDGKMAGGYCTFLKEYGYPFIFSNFNGTSHDIDVLTHEAGHAFQVYRSRNLPLEEYYWPTLEACEIHSMSMEFFTWPWMEFFFKEDTEKYKFSHLAGALTFMPYGAAIDEFQHFVYENPECTIAERNAKWKSLEQEYLPYLDNDNNTYLESGRGWQKQGHVYKVPFYYIDYTLAQICALQFWERAQQDFKSAWKDYLNLCDAGGSKPFTELVELAGLKSPFIKDNMKGVVSRIETYLAGVDDINL